MEPDASQRYTTRCVPERPRCGLVTAIAGGERRGAAIKLSANSGDFAFVSRDAGVVGASIGSVVAMLDSHMRRSSLRRLFQRVLVRILNNPDLHQVSLSDRFVNLYVK